MDIEKLEHEQDVISLGDEDEIRSNPSPVIDEKWLDSPEALAGDTKVPTNDTSKLEGETTFEHEMSKLMDLNADTANAPVEKKPIEVITIDSSEDEAAAAVVQPKPTTQNDSTLDFSTNDMSIDPSSIAAPDASGVDVKVEDEDEPKPNAPFANPKPTVDDKEKPAGKIIVPFGIPEPTVEDEIEDDADEDYGYLEDETIGERIYALREMFPETFRNASHFVATGSLAVAKGLYGFTRAAVWIAATSAVILAAPVLIESEKTQIEEMNRQQQRQILLGPGAAGGSGGLTPNLTQPMR